MKLPLRTREYVPAGGPCLMIWDADRNRIAEAVAREDAEHIVRVVNIGGAGPAFDSEQDAAEAMANGRNTGGQPYR